MSFYLIRHADKEDGEYYSTRLPLNNQPLSENGLIQAQKLIEYFQKIEVSQIFVSEYIRTLQTIESVSKMKNITPIIDKRLNEINIGDTDRLTDQEIENRFPEFWRAYIERINDFRFPNGESGEEAGARIFEIFQSIDINKNTIFVAHDGIIRTLICKILGMATYKRHHFRIDLCSITTCEYQNELKSWQISKLNYSIN